MTQQPEMRLVPVEPTEAMFAAFRDADYNSAEGFRQAWAAALSAAPQPEPVGDLREKVARILDPQTFELIAHYTGIDRGDGLTPEQREPEVFKGYPSLKAQRDDAYAKADQIAALSDTAGVGE